MHVILSLLFKFLSLYLGLTTSLFTMSALGNTTASFYARLLTSYACLVICASYGLFASIFLRLIGYHRISQWATARAFKYTMRLSTGVRFEVVAGKQYLGTRPAVFVGNHQTALDVLLLGTIFPRYCSVTAKKSLKRMPFLGWFMALSGTVFIDRASRTSALKAFEGAAEEIKREQQSVFIFPEGTRSYAEEPMLLGFKKGAFHLAIQAGVPIVPIVAGCYWGVLGARESRFRAGTIPVQVLPPIPTENLTVNDVDDLTKYTRDVMLRQLIRLTESPRGQRAAKAEIPEAPMQPRAPTEPAATPETPLATTTGAQNTEEEAKETGTGDDLRRRQEEMKGTEESKGTGGAETNPEEQ